jgi:hypothetical protein
MPQGASSLYQLIRMESFSIYLNPSCGTCGLVTHLVGAGSTQYCWRNELRRGLETFSINKEDFDFSKCLCHHLYVLGASAKVWSSRPDENWCKYSALLPRSLFLV